MAEALKIVAISRYKDPQGFRAAQTRFLKYRGFAKSCPIVMNLPPINLVDAQKLDAAVALFEAQLREHEITTPPRRFACGNSDSNSGPALWLYARGKRARWRLDRCCLREFSTQLGTRWSQRLVRRALRLTAVAWSGNRLPHGSGGNRPRQGIGLASTRPRGGS
jgi:hypothetical protein